MQAFARAIECHLGKLRLRDNRRRTVKIRSTSGAVHEYVRVVEAFRQDGKVKQRVVADLGRKDRLIEILPKLRRLLAGESPGEDGEPSDPLVSDASNWGPVLVVQALFDQLGFWAILDQDLGRAGCNRASAIDYAAFWGFFFPEPP